MKPELDEFYPNDVWLVSLSSLEIPSRGAPPEPDRSEHLAAFEHRVARAGSLPLISLNEYTTSVGYTEVSRKSLRAPRGKGRIDLPVMALGGVIALRCTERLFTFTPSTRFSKNHGVTS